MNESQERFGSLGRVLVPILLVIVLILGIVGGYFGYQTMEYRKMTEVGYRRAVQEAADDLSNISSNLVKGMYAGTDAQLSQISSLLWKDASSAKAALSALPIAELHLDKTSRFLSQVGEYAMYLSRTPDITLEERKNFQRMREYADRLSDQIHTLDHQLDSGEITFREIESSIRKNKNSSGADEDETSLSTNSSLDGMEAGFMGYPSLIYDGPFSDHILDKSPRMTKGKPQVTEEEARVKAHQAVGKNADIHNLREENSTLPSYVFYSDEFSVSVTKNGGYLCYVIRPQPSEVRTVLSAEDALNSAKHYLITLGIESMKDTYYEIHDGIMTVNFAYDLQGITCYTDLIKVDVSMETGEILAYDARGYLVNHQARSFDAPKLSQEQAAAVLSPELTVESCKLALIPTPGKNEVLTYEFRAMGSAGDHVLVYVNANTGAEEQILILIEDESGVLTK